MREYELLFIVNPECEDDRLKEVIEKFTGIVTRDGGEILKVEEWGRQKLAYEIGKFSKGSYVLLGFAGGTTLASELERNLRLDEQILKFLTVKLSDQVDPEKRRIEIAAARVKAVEQAARDAAAGPRPDRDRDRDRDHRDRAMD
jgi:small subunit ribosomal protein S6